ncbi:unnamed protein product [Cuscuta epithymum]|uniref:Uncharacterized protein n=1 Tax=Cuscuta epithymum TaxID=186058 RepID=A0AAV0D3A7_9ASTE|nr:unnamed protein product [Cuscuta epithymum]
MGIWGFITSGTDLLKRNTPDPVKRACTASYGYGAGAVGMIGNACGQIGIRHLNPIHYVPDGETRSKIAAFSTKFVKNAAVYTFEETCKKNPFTKGLTSVYKQTMGEMVWGNQDSGSSMKPDSSEPMESVDVDLDPIDLREREDEHRRIFVPVKELVSSRFFNELIIRDVLIATCKDCTATHIPQTKIPEEDD